MEEERQSGKTPNKKDAALSLTATLLFALGVMLLPGGRLGGLFLSDEVSARLLGNAIFRTVGFFIAFFAAYKMGLRPFKAFSLPSFLLCLPFAAVVAGNFPIGAAINGTVALSAGAARTVCFLYYCLSVGAFEEIVFRGMLLPLCCAFFKERFCGFFAAVLSSAIFALCHLVNLIGGNAGAVFMQVGYSFLVGGMCAVVFLLCRNAGFCIIIHTLFDVGGLMAEFLGNGMTWGALDIALSAVTAVAGTAYALWILFTFPSRTYADFTVEIG